MVAIRLCSYSEEYDSVLNRCTPCPKNHYSPHGTCKLCSITSPDNELVHMCANQDLFRHFSTEIVDLESFREGRAKEGEGDEGDGGMKTEMIWIIILSSILGLCCLCCSVGIGWCMFAGSGSNGAQVWKGPRPMAGMPGRQSAN